MTEKDILDAIESLAELHTMVEKTYKMHSLHFSTETELFTNVHNALLALRPVEDKPKNKYSREIKPGVWVDVYDVLRAFPTNCPAMDHAAKKVLAAGKRGHKDTITDKKDIIASVKRSMEQDDEWGGKDG